MLEITSEQVRAFDADRRRRFVRDTAVAMREEWPEPCATLSEPALRRRIDDTITAAAPYGIFGERDLFRFINLTFLWGETFYSQQDWARAIVTNQNLTGPDRVHLLVTRSAEHLAAQAAEG
jgi:hypothetical protein